MLPDKFKIGKRTVAPKKNGNSWHAHIAWDSGNLAVLMHPHKFKTKKTCQEWCKVVKAEGRIRHKLWRKIDRNGKLFNLSA